MVIAEECACEPFRANRDPVGCDIVQVDVVGEAEDDVLHIMRKEIIFIDHHVVPVHDVSQIIQIMKVVNGHRVGQRKTVYCQSGSAGEDGVRADGRAVSPSQSRVASLLVEPVVVAHILSHKGFGTDKVARGYFCRPFTDGIDMVVVVKRCIC